MTERPVECSHCQKPANITYKEIVNHQISCMEMCSDCPMLAQKLYGYDVSDPLQTNRSLEGSPPIVCSHCMTTLEGIKTGNPLGCSACYVVFEETLLKELCMDKKKMPLHAGKSPHKSTPVFSPEKLPALNEALTEALKKENYEQAACIRDQIKELMGNSVERKNEPS